ncbi:MAG: hypothetical protein AB8B46_01580 [Candidatus Midichloriaceae bacterium]
MQSLNSQLDLDNSITSFNRCNILGSFGPQERHELYESTFSFFKLENILLLEDKMYNMDERIIKEYKKAKHDDTTSPTP